MISHPYKKIQNKNKFRESVAKASSILCEPVASTLGPDGLPILIKQYEGKAPKITKDGVTVADSIFVEDPYVDTIIQAIKEAARKTNTEAGDGTTTCIVLTDAIIKESLKYILSDAITPQQLSSAMHQIKEIVFKSIIDNSVKIENDEQLLNVALISSNNDRVVAEAVVKAVNDAGEYGIVTIEEGYKAETEIAQISGFYMDTGFQKVGPVGSALITHQDKQEILYNSPYILIYDGDFTDEKSLQSFYNTFNPNGEKALVIIAYSFSDYILQIIANSRHSGAKVIPVIAPVYSSSSVRRIYLEDFAAWCGARVIDQNPKSISILLKTIKQDNKTDYKLHDLAHEYIGRCSKISMKRNMTVFYDGEGEQDKILERVKGLKSLLDETLVPYEQDVFKHRLAMLTNGVVTINVGGTTEFEMKERKDRVIDAMSAVRASVEMGVVPGGGTISLLISKTINNYLESNEKLEENLKIASKILVEVFKYPIRLLAKNSGLSADNLENIISICLSRKPRYGYNARTKAYEDDIIEAGVIDPAKVAHCAFKNALSISLELLCGGGSIVYEDKSAQEKQDIEGYYHNENNY